MTFVPPASPSPNLLDYFRETIFSIVELEEGGEMLKLCNPRKGLAESEEQVRLIDLVLNVDGGAGDGCTDGDILAEMPVDSACGSSCKRAVDNAAKMIADCRMAYGMFHYQEHMIAIMKAAVSFCSCYIRG